MGIALVCDVPGCGVVISPEETEEMLERFGDEKPPAISVALDGCEHMVIEDACKRHRDEFKRLVDAFLSARPVDEAAPKQKAAPKAKRVGGGGTVVPGGIDAEAERIEMERAAVASSIALEPLELFSGPDVGEEASAPEKDASAPQKAPQAASGASDGPPVIAAQGPRPFKLTSQRRSATGAAPARGPVSAVLEDEGVEEIIEPSYAGMIDFSDTRPV